MGLEMAEETKRVSKKQVEIEENFEWSDRSCNKDRFWNISVDVIVIILKRWQWLIILTQVFFADKVTRLVPSLAWYNQYN